MHGKYSWHHEFGDQFKGRRVLVTGAGGFVGSHLCTALVSLGAEVYGVDLNNFFKNEVNGIRLLNVDLSINQDVVQETVKIVNPDFTYHLAGLVDTRQEIGLVLPTLRHNLFGTVHLLIALKGSQCRRVVVISSSETPQYGNSPNSPYAASKLAMAAYAEMFHTLFGLPVVIARPHLSYGPRQPQNKLIPYLICSMLKDTPPMLSSGNRICDMIYINDLVRALLLMTISEFAVGCSFDIGTGEGISVREIAARISVLMKTPCHPVFGTVVDRIGEFSQVANTKMIHSSLGWKPYWTMDEGLIETIEWYKDNAGVEV